MISGGVLGGAMTLGETAAAASVEGAPGSKHQQEWYELRTYYFVNDEQRGVTEAYLEKAFIPALNRAGITRVGVFIESEPSTGAVARLFLLLAFPDMSAFTGLPARMAGDSRYIQDGEAYLAAPATSPAYQRIESSLMKAFAHMPAMETPEKKARMFELRCYESPTESAGQKKIEMFNDAGEIDIFKKVGARPVFFGETVIGLRRPNLTYMLCFDDMAAHDARWKAFGTDAEWKAVSSRPEYSDAKLISKITRTFLTPAVYSQI